MTEPPRLELRGIGKQFGQTWVLRDVSLTVRPGQVHAVAGLNGSGKSTLMRAVYGAHQPSAGEIRLDGAACRFRSPREALARGVAAVPQELPVVPELSVTENIYLGMLPSAAGLVWERTAHREATRILAHLHATAEVPDVHAPVHTLDLAGQQLVTVARALVRQAGVVVFDEPTSALPGSAAARLRDVIRTLRADGKAILFISQRLHDVLDIADEITVLRDGQTVAQAPASSFTPDTLTHLMVHGGGRPGGAGPAGGSAVPNARRTSTTTRPSGAALRVRGLCTSRLADVSLDASAGELVGLFGLPGSGASEILRAVFGADPATAGTIELDGAPIAKGTRRRIDAGLAYITGDRQTSLLGEMSVAANIALPGSRRITRAIWPGREARTARDLIATLNIQPPDPHAMVATLSGGNQQKVLIARWLTHTPRVWLLDDPTRGVDVQAQADIRQLIRDRVAAGACGLIYSSDPTELLPICDRGLVIAGGQVTGEVDPRLLDADELSGLLEGSKR